jgi:hypothetical protein
LAGSSRKRRKVHRKDIENRFASAGWHLDGGFADHLVIGYSDDGLSILARKEAWEADDDPVFELIDHERDLTYGVWEIPTPDEAQEMLRELGKPPAEEGD